MLIAVDFISLDALEATLPAADLAVLSLGDPDAGQPVNLHRFPWYSRLEFLDVDPRETELRDPQMACLPWQMQEIIEFIERIHLDPEHWRLAVHCTFGSSRSAAAALIAHAMTSCQMPRHTEAHGANAWMLLLAQGPLGQPISVPAKPELDTYTYLTSRLQI